MTADRTHHVAAEEADAQLATLLERERLSHRVAVTQRDRLAKRLQSLQSELVETRTHLEAAVAASAHARTELESLWNSSSWRYTRPLREAGLVVRRVIRRGRSMLSNAELESVAASGVPVSLPGTNTNELLSSESERALNELRQAMREREGRDRQETAGGATDAGLSGRSNGWWFGLLVALCVCVAAILAGDVRLFFTDYVVPAGDWGSNDILVSDAKRLALLHGNYSRVGFYHPGPFYMQWMALSELVLYDGVAIVASPFSAQLAGLIVLHAAAIGVMALLWRRLFGEAWLALVAVAITMAAVLWPIGQNYLILAWPPFMYVPSALLAAAAIVGLVTGDVRWLPVLVLGTLQLVHGHASFIGLAPLMLVTALASAVVLRAVPLRRLFTFEPIRRQPWPFVVSAVLVLLFALPIAAQAWVDWPGEIPKYFEFANTPRSHGWWDAVRYVGVLIPGFGAWFLLLLAPPSRSWLPEERAKSLRAAALIVAASAGLPGLVYAWRGVDTLTERYMIFWVLPFFGLALAIAVVYAASTLPRRMGVVALAGCALAAVFGLRAFVPGGFEARWIEARHVARVTRATAAVLRQQVPAGTRIALHIDPDNWVRSWPDIVALLALMNREHADRACVEPSSWHLLFHVRYRCAPQQAGRLYRVTTRERAPAGWRWELPHTVIAPLTPATTGRFDMASASAHGLMLVGDWSGLEEWGVWSAGDQADLIIAASALPRKFSLEIATRIFPPRTLREQRIHILDAAGRKLATISNNEPANPVTIPIERTGGPDEQIRLTFQVDAPVSPLELGAGDDSRRLGVGLESVTVKE